MQDDASGLLRQLTSAKESKSEHLMVGVCEEICTLLCIGSEEHVRGVDPGPFVKTLIEVLSMPTNIPELKVFTMRAIALVLDTVPRSGPTAVSHNVIPVITAQLATPMVSVQYAEELLKALESLSLDYSHLILDSGVLPVAVRWLSMVGDGRERVHVRIISILANISSRLRQSDLTRVMPILPVLASLIAAAGERRVESTVERDGVDFTISKICLTVAHLVDRLGTIEGLFDALTENGVLQALLATISSSGYSIQDDTVSLTSRTGATAAAPKPISPIHRSFVLRVLSVIYTANPQQGISLFIGHNVIRSVCGLVTRACSPSALGFSMHEESSQTDSHHTPHLFREEASVSGVIDFLSLLLPSLPENPVAGTGVLVPFHSWAWEDDYHNLSVFEDVICQKIESEYIRQRKSGALRNVEISVSGRSYTVNFLEMKQCSKHTKMTRAIYRDPIPSHYITCQPGGVDSQQHRASTGSVRRGTSGSVFRSNQVHPMPSELWEDDPHGHTEISEKSNDDESVSCFAVLKNKLNCFKNTADEDSDVNERRVIDAGPCDEQDLREVTSHIPALESKLICTDSFLRHLLLYCLPPLISLLNSTVNPLLMREASVTVGRVVVSYVQYAGHAAEDPEQFTELDEITAMMNAAASRLCQTLVTVLHCSAGFSPLQFFDNAKHVLGQYESEFSVYGETLGAALLVAQVLLKSRCAGVYKTMFQRAGLHEALDKITRLPETMRARGQFCCSKAPEDHVCLGKTNLQHISDGVVIVANLLGPATSLPHLEVLNEAVALMDKGESHDVMDELVKTIKKEGITSYELMHPSCTALKALSNYLSRTTQPDQVTGTPLKLMYPEILRRALGVLKQCTNQYLLQSLPDGTIFNINNTRTSHQQPGRVLPITPVTIPLGVSLAAANYAAAILNAAQERMGRPLSIRCIPAQGEAEDCVLSLTAFPFVTFGCLERNINLKKEERCVSEHKRSLPATSSSASSVSSDKTPAVPPAQPLADASSASSASHQAVASVGPDHSPTSVGKSLRSADDASTQIDEKPGNGGNPLDSSKRPPPHPDTSSATATVTSPVQPMSPGSLSQARPARAGSISSAQSGTAPISLAVANSDTVSSRSSLVPVRNPSTAQVDEVECITAEAEIPRPLEFSIDGHVVPSKRMTLLDAIVQYSQAGLTMRKIISSCSADNEQHGKLPSNRSYLGKALTLWNTTVTIHYKRVSPVSVTSPEDEKRRKRSAGHTGEEQLESALKIKAILSPVVHESAACGDGEKSGVLQTLVEETHDQKMCSALVHELHYNILPVAIPAFRPLMDIHTDPRRFMRSAMRSDPRLFPLELRMQHFNMLVFGAKVALLKSIVPPSFLAPLGGNGSWLPSSRSVVGQNWLRTPGMWGRVALRKQKVSVSRTSVFHCAELLLQRQATSPLQLDIFFTGEPGTGLGPTTEFYTMVSQAFQSKALGMWRGETDAKGYVHSPTGLFPDVISQLSVSAQQKILQKFVFFGRFVGRALRESKVLDLHMNPIFIKLMLEIDVLSNAPQSMATVDPDYERSLGNITMLKNLPKEEAQEAVEALGIDFTLPGYEKINLLPGGCSRILTLNEVDLYTSLVRAKFLKDGIAEQMRSFFHGLQEVIPQNSLQLFNVTELQTLLCGKQNSNERIWSSVDQFLRDVVSDHGYTMNSDPVIQLTEVVAEMSPEEQRKFLVFVSGSPKLPLGGLVPKITIVRRGGEFEHIDENYLLEDPLPSVNTCFHYLKLPAYSSKLVLKEKLLYAISEGQGSFDLS